MKSLHKIMLSALLATVYCTGTVRPSNPPEFLEIIRDKDTVERNELVNWRVVLNSDVDNPFDFDSIQLMLIVKNPFLEEDTVYGFYTQDYEIIGKDELEPAGPPFWGVRFRPDIPGIWSTKLIITDVFGTDESGWNDILVNNTSSAYQKIELAPNQRNWQFTDGTPFFAMGENLGWVDFTGGFSDNTLYFDSLQAQGANFAKIFLVPWSYAFEWNPAPVGDYRLKIDRTFVIDWILDEADKRSIKIALTIMNQSDLQDPGDGNTWINNPYNAINGGPCETPQEFFIKEEARKHFRNKLQYLINRYAHHNALFAWDLLGEADNFPFYNSFKPFISNWAIEMATYIKNNDRYSNMVSVGYALNEENYEVYSHPNIDYSQLHIYTRTKEIAPWIVKQVYRMLKSFDKPVISSEFGLATMPEFINENDPDGIALHNAIWAHLLAGGFGSVWPWWWDSYVAPQHLYYHYKNPVETALSISNISSAAPETFVSRISNSGTRNQLIEPLRDDVLISTPTDTFEILPFAGSLPAEDSLNIFLLGTNPAYEDIRKPPVFILDHEEDFFFIINTGVTVNNAVLRVYLDGLLIIDEVAQPQESYMLSVPTGKHFVKVENSSNQIFSLLEIDSYELSDYQSLLWNQYIQYNEAQIIGRVAHVDYNWEYLKDGGMPQTIEGGQMKIDGIANQQAYIEWYNTLDGSFIASAYEPVFEGEFVTTVPDIIWDASYRIELITGLHANKSFSAHDFLHLYPNPVREQARLSFYLDQEARVYCYLYDIQGRKISEKQWAHLGSGRHNIKLGPQFLLNPDLVPGVYIIQLVANDKAGQIRMVFQP